MKPYPLIVRLVSILLGISFPVSSLLSLMPWPASAHEVSRPAVPQYQFPIDDNRSGILQSDVSLILQLLQMAFAKDLQDPESPLEQGFDWNQSALGAGSNLVEGHFKLMLWGGFVRARYQNLGSLSAVLCHELGHRLGGEPHQVFDHQVHWSSAEGQSDHFAATVCLPKLYDLLQKFSPSFLQQQVEPVAQSLCSQTSMEISKCQWVITSGIDMIQVLQVYFDLDVPFADPVQTATEKVTKTLNVAYPSYQCRMEIFKQGALCEAGLSCPRQPCWSTDP